MYKDYITYYILHYCVLITIIIITTSVITNGPMNTTVCIGSVANISCGFVDLTNILNPNWRISIISDLTVSTADVNNTDGLQYIPDLTSGVNMSPNSRLVVGPVNETFNQSSYQCILPVGSAIESSVGILTVTGECIN